MLPTSASNFFRSMGGAFGAALGGAILAHRLGDELAARLGEDRLVDPRATSVDAARHPGVSL